jgi:hypothetical protein
MFDTTSAIGSIPSRLIRYNLALPMRTTNQERSIPSRFQTTVNKKNQQPLMKNWSPSCITEMRPYVCGKILHINTYQPQYFLLLDTIEWVSSDSYQRIVNWVKKSLLKGCCTISLSGDWTDEVCTLKGHSCSAGNYRRNRVGSINVNKID